MDTIRIKADGSIRIKDKRFKIDGNAIMYKGHNTWQGDTPKTYKRCGVIYHSIGNDYNPRTLEVFINRQGILKYCIYRDGNFYPYFGTIEFNNMDEVK